MTPLDDQIERPGIQLVNEDLPEGSTSTKMSSPSVPSMQRRLTLTWVCHSTLFYILH